MAHDPSFTQSSYRFRFDDGSESGATWITEFANQTISYQTDENLRVRFLISEGSGNSATNQAFKLQYNVNSGGWNDVNGSSSNVRSSASSNLTDAEDTTQQLGAGTLTTPNDGVDEADGSVGGNDLDIGGFEQAELEFCIQLRSADVAHDDSIQLRVVEDDGSSTALTTYTNTPTVTVAGHLEKLAPTATEATSNVSGAYTDIDDDPFSSDANWVTYTSESGDTEIRVSFASPARDLETGARRQKFVLRGRRSSNGGTDPVLQIQLFESGNYRDNNNITITGDGEFMATFLWDASSLTSVSGADVECLLKGVASTGTPRTIEFGALEWHADVTAPSGTTYNETGSGTLTLSGDGTPERVMDEAGSGTVTLSGDGTPERVMPETGTGTVTLSGQGQEGKEYTDAGSGTVTLSGAVSDTLSYDESGTGTVTLSGSGADTHVHAETSTGTLTLSGDGTPERVMPETGAGTVTLSGQGQEGLVFAESATGTITLSGDGTPERVMSESPTGTLALSGDGADTQDHVATGTGTLTLSGEGADTLDGATEYNETGSGSLVLSGDGSDAQTHAATGTGTLSLSGTGADSQVHVVTSAGTVALSGAGAPGHAHAEASVGTLTLSGAGSDAQTHAVTASGTVTLSGDGADTLIPAAGSTTYNETGSGSLSLSGGAVLYLNPEAVLEAVLATGGNAGAVLQTGGNLDATLRTGGSTTAPKG